MKYLTILFLLLTYPSYAVDIQGSYQVQGGGQSCGKYIQGDRVNKLVTSAWVAGWITANNYNSTIYDTMKGNDLDSIMLWLSNHCRRNPLSNIPAAMIELTKKLDNK